MSDDLIAKLEELGEDVVRAKLAKGEYGSKGHERNMVDDWLHMKAQSRSIFSNRELIRLARRANTKANIAIGIVIATMIVAIIGLILS